MSNWKRDVLAYEQRRNDLAIQVTQFEEAGRTEERGYFPVKARHVAVDWEVRQNRTKLEKNVLRRSRLMDKCEGYCRELRQVLRYQEDLQTQARDRYELDHSKDQLMTLFKVGLANLGMWVRDHYFGASYQHCGGPRLLPFFKLGGWVTTTAREVKLEVCAFNNRALGRDARGGMSQSQRPGSHFAGWKAAGDDRRTAASRLSGWAAGSNQLSLILVASCGKKFHFLEFPVFDA